MTTAVYFCRCGGNISNQIDGEDIHRGLTERGEEVHFRSIDLMCSADGLEALEEDLRRHRVDRVVVAACSPRDHELTFRGALTNAGLNPFLMQMVNVREQIAWVTPSKEAATEKALRAVVAALDRVALHQPLTASSLEVTTDVCVVGAGPAGLKAALTIASSGRKVVVVERSPFIGGRPVRYEEVFPSFECGACMLEPLLHEVLHGEHSSSIEILTLSEVTGLKGFFGNFQVTTTSRPRYVNTATCIGCAECIAACPVSVADDLSTLPAARKAMGFAFESALPNAPFIVEGCDRFHGEDCTLCLEACPVPETVLYDQEEEVREVRVGAIVLAVGFEEYDSRKVLGLGNKDLADVYEATEIEHMLVRQHGTDKAVVTADGGVPEKVAIIHCVGSLDSDHCEYCSEICCRYAFKISHLIASAHPDSRIFHFFKELVLPGLDGADLSRRVQGNDNATLVRYRDIGDFKYYYQSNQQRARPFAGLEYRDAEGQKAFERFDMLILCPAVVPPADLEHLADLCEIPLGPRGFFKSLHEIRDSSQSTIKGVFLAGGCQGPTDIEGALSRSMAATGSLLADLVPGRTLEISPLTAVVDEQRCSGCRLCPSLCPYGAISFDEEGNSARVNGVLCEGCGTCGSACPIDAITSMHFTSAQISAEIEGLLKQ